MLRIAFGCQSRVGKDYACEYLQKRYGGVILHFSDPLYNAQSICGFSKKKILNFYNISAQIGLERKIHPYG